MITRRKLFGMLAALPVAIPFVAAAKERPLERKVVWSMGEMVLDTSDWVIYEPGSLRIIQGPGDFTSGETYIYGPRPDRER